jgi:predicted Zn-dependent protease
VEYSNPEIPEGINTSKEHPLKEFVLLSAGVLGLIFAVVLILGVLADKLAPYIPFTVEQSIAGDRFAESDPDLPINKYLNELASRVVAVEGLPDGMTITVHYVDDDTVNAFATLGGNILMFRGLLEQLDNENALAMVMAHEVAHVKHRHPIRSAGRGVVIGLALSMVSSSLGNAMVDTVLGQAGQVTVLSFSRDHEKESDQTALLALVKMYGHVEGATDLFEILKHQEKFSVNPEFYSSHPLTDNRLKKIAEFSEGLNLSEAGKKTGLPKSYSEWLEQD